jgi:HK97 gp10 family phage protein
MQIIIEGAAEARKALAGLPRKVQNKVLRQAVRQALKPVLAAAKANVPRDTGELAQSLVIRVVKGRRRGEIALQVVTEPSRFEGAPHAAAVEFGTSDTLAQPFMAETFVQTGEIALSIAERRILEGLEHAIRNA